MPPLRVRRDQSRAKFIERFIIKEVDQLGCTRIANRVIQRTGHRCGVRVTGSRHERALCPFEQNSGWKDNDLGLHEGGELVLDRAEIPAHPAFRGEECDLIPDMELEAAEANKLERAGGAGVTT